MAHSLNNATKQQFKDRVASFSTHGSRRGFVDIALPIPKDQLNDARDEYLSLREESRILQQKITDFRKEFGLDAGTKLKNVLSENEWYGKLKKRTWPAARVKAYEDARALSARFNLVNVEMSALRSRLQISADPEDDETLTFTTRSSVKGEFKISKIVFIRHLLFRAVVAQIIGKELTKMVDLMVEELGVRVD